MSVLAIGFDPEKSVITPYQFEYNGTQYAVGAWMTPIEPTQPLFAIVRLENDKWMSFGGTQSWLSEETVQNYGGNEEFLRRHIDGWNKRFFNDELEVPESFFVEFGLYLHAHIYFSNGRFVFIE